MDEAKPGIAQQRPSMVDQAKMANRALKERVAEASSTAAWVAHSEDLRRTNGGPRLVPLVEQIDQANARAKERLTARLAAGNEPTEPGFQGSSVPISYSFPGSRDRRPAAGGDNPSHPPR